MRWPEEHGRLRRWRERSPYQVGGVWYRVVKGRKGADDLRLEHHVEGRWTPVYMAETFMQADFFAENEQWLEQERDHWRQGGAAYFLSQIAEAVRYGWERVAERITDQRGRREDGIKTAPHVCGAYCREHR